MAAIEHVFVLMMENRSFDHFFGLSGLPGVPRPPEAEFGPGASDWMLYDPPHDFDGVDEQVKDRVFDPRARKGFEPGEIPVVTGLASQYLLMDNWYSPMPGPTWPNRFFAHAASSGGMANNPRWQDYGSILVPSVHFRFEHGHVFDRLLARGHNWRVYHGDWPQMLALEGMAGAFVNDRSNVFRPNTELASDLAAGDAASYTWIEPTHSAETGFLLTDSQHPRGSVRRGEKLIQQVYNAVRASPLWERSLLVVTWDEHGGFYDHMPPPPAIPPGDEEWNRNRTAEPRPFKFDRLGPRVPALLISPLLPQGLGSQVFPGSRFEHSSIVASLRQHFDLGPEFTRRDGTAPVWTDVLLAAPRAVDLGPVDLALDMSPPPTADSVDRPPDENLLGFALIAKSLDFEIARATGQAPVAAAQQLSMESASRAMTARSSGAKTLATADAAGARQDVLAYMAQVRAREQAFRNKPD